MRLIDLLPAATRRALVLASLLFAALPALSAEYASIAWSADGKSWGWARKASQKQADQAALDGCNQDAAKKDCRVSVMKAVVHAAGAKRVGYGWSEKSVKDARSSALRSCGDADCKVVREFTEPGFIALARTKNEQAQPHFFVSYAFSNSDRADEDAIAGCAKNAGEDCRVAWSGAIGGKMAAPLAATRPAPAAAATKSCRPNTPQVRCTSQCVNGNCLVTYENGCKMRVQVNARFDPFTNQWTYPAPSC